MDNSSSDANLRSSDLNRAVARMKMITDMMIDEEPAPTSAPFGNDHVKVVLDTDVNWANAQRPTVPTSAVADRPADHLWYPVAAAKPAWVNLALYRTDPPGGCMIVTQSRTSAPSAPDQPVTMSRGGPDAVLVIVPDVGSPAMRPASARSWSPTQWFRRRSTR